MCFYRPPLSCLPILFFDECRSVDPFLVLFSYCCSCFWFFYLFKIQHTQQKKIEGKRGCLLLNLLYWGIHNSAMVSRLYINKDFFIICFFFQFSHYSPLENEKHKTQSRISFHFLYLFIHFLSSHEQVVYVETVLPSRFVTVWQWRPPPAPPPEPCTCLMWSRLPKNVSPPPKKSPKISLL